MEVVFGAVLVLYAVGAALTADFLFYDVGWRADRRGTGIDLFFIVYGSVMWPLAWCALMVETGVGRQVGRWAEHRLGRSNDDGEKASSAGVETPVPESFTNELLGAMGEADDASTRRESGEI